MPLDEATRKLIDDLLAGRITAEEAKKRTKPAKTREQLEIEAEQQDVEERVGRLKEKIMDDVRRNDPMFAGGTFEQEAYERDLEIAAEADKQLKRR